MHNVCEFFFVDNFSNLLVGGFSPCATIDLKAEAATAINCIAEIWNVFLLPQHVRMFRGCGNACTVLLVSPLLVPCLVCHLPVVLLKCFRLLPLGSAYSMPHRRAFPACSLYVLSLSLRLANPACSRTVA